MYGSFFSETRDKGNKELEAANAKVANLRRLALKYKSEVCDMHIFIN